MTDLDRRHRLPSAEPLRPVRRDGVWLVEAGGRRVPDACNNVPSVGHGHPRVAGARARQAATLNTHARCPHGAEHADFRADRTGEALAEGGLQ